MQNVTNSMNISVYVDGNDIMFLFKNVTEEQKRQLMNLANDICNAGVNTFTTLSPKEVVSEPAPTVENMQPVMETKPVVPGDEVNPDTIKNASDVIAEAKADDVIDIYAMSKVEATQYLIKNIDSGVFVGFDNLIRAYFVANGLTKEDAESKLAGNDAKEMFKKNEQRLLKFVNKNRNGSEFEA